MIRHRWLPTQSVKDLIESHGVPHTEIDVILVDGVSVDLACRPRAGQRISVYPVFESFDVRPLLRLRAEPLREIRFVLDGHLGTLARRLRLLGFDSRWDAHPADADLVEASVRERRALLTRDRFLLRRRLITHGYLLRSDRPDEQMQEVLRRFQLGASIEPFSRCVACNGRLQPVEKDRIEHRLPPGTRRSYDDFHTCPECGRDYWAGAHRASLERIVQAARAADQPSSSTSA